MPKLKCNVGKCAHNKEGLCAKNYIDVDGPTSKSKKETSCRSYIFKDVDTFDYEFADMGKSPTLQTEVYCDAMNCVYEKGQRCYADRIEISNTKDAQNAKSKRSSCTQCSTFEPRD